MTSHRTGEMKISMQEIVRLYTAVNDSIFTIDNCTSGDLLLKEDYEKLSKKLTVFMFEYEKKNNIDEFKKEIFTLHIPK